MGALPPIMEMRVTGGELTSRKTLRTRAWKTRGGELVLRPGLPRGGLGWIRTMDPGGEARWEIREANGLVFATQRNPRREDGKREWIHFLDSLNMDVSPYVHAAVARLSAVLAGIDVREPEVDDGASCLACKAFRVLPGPDVKLGDVESRVPSISTYLQKDEGPWQVEQYWCSALQDHPPDIKRMIPEYNRLARRGHPNPVLPLSRAGEDCPVFLSKKAGQLGGKPAWEIPAGYAMEPVVERGGTTNTLRVRGAQWELVLQLEGKGAAQPEQERWEEKLPERIIVKDPSSDRVDSFALSETGDPTRGVLSYRSPLVQAALKASPGEEFIVRAPGGIYRLVRIA